MNLYHKLGYDFVPLWPEWPGHPKAKNRQAADTAAISKGERIWVEEGKGLIHSWETMEAFPWDRIRHAASPIDIAARHLPQGMKITVGCTLFEHVLERLMGYEGLFYLIHDDPELVGQVFARWGEKVHAFYELYRR